MAKIAGIYSGGPLIGDGTGSIRDQFNRSAAGQTGVSAIASHNPHNQTLAVGIQLGLVGIAVLLVMWAAHLVLFRSGSLAAWTGLVVVVQNIVGSVFNSHLFDFTQGWAYVIGVGITGAIVLKEIEIVQSRAAESAVAQVRLAKERTPTQNRGRLSGAGQTPQPTWCAIFLASDFPMGISRSECLISV